MATSLVKLRWAGAGLRFEGGRAGGPEIMVDSDGVAGPSPTTALLLALAGCMAVDVVEITTKMRVPLTGLAVEVEGERRAESPRRFTAIRLKYIVSGAGAECERKVWRAIELSRDKYCSVWHSLKDDIDFSIALELR